MRTCCIMSFDMQSWLPTLHINPPASAAASLSVYAIVHTCAGNGETCLFSQKHYISHYVRRNIRRAVCVHSDPKPTQMRWAQKVGSNFATGAMRAFLPEGLMTCRVCREDPPNLQAARIIIVWTLSCRFRWKAMWRRCYEFQSWVTLQRSARREDKKIRSLSDTGPVLGKN